MIREALNKYNSIPKAVKAAFWFTFCSFVQQAISFITTPIFTRIMTTKEYGVWTLFSTWSSVMMVVATLNLQGGGFGNAMLKFESKRDSFVSSMIGLEFVLLLGWLGIVALLRNQISYLLDMPMIYVYIMLGTNFFNMIYSLWAQKNRYEYRYKPLLLVTILYSVSVSLFGILAIMNWPGHRVLARMTSNLLVNIVLFSILAAIVFKRGKTFYNQTFWKFMLQFNIPLVPHYLSQIVLSSCDRVMIGRLCGEDYAAIYGVSYSIANIITIVLSSVSSALGPWLYDKLQAKKYSEIIPIENGLAVFFAALSLFPILLGPEAVAIMAPAEYQKAIWVMPPVASSVYFMYLYNIYGNIEFYYEKKSLVAIGSMIMAIANIILNYIFIKVAGFVAAGYTTLVCYVGYSVCHWIFSQKVLRRENVKEPVFNNKFLIGLGIGVLFVTVLSNLLYLNSIVRYVILVGMMIIAVVKRNLIIGMMKQLKGN